MAERLLPVSVAYALPEQQWVVELELPEGSTVADALAAVAATAPFTDLDVQQLPVGIYGAPADPATPLEPHDRVELYRPLLVDPKTARRQRAAQAQSDTSAASAEDAGR